jgi:hypothetical protein
MYYNNHGPRYCIFNTELETLAATHLDKMNAEMKLPKRPQIATQHWMIPSSQNEKFTIIKSSSLSYTGQSRVVTFCVKVTSVMLLLSSILRLKKKKKTKRISKRLSRSQDLVTYLGFFQSGH